MIAAEGVHLSYGSTTALAGVDVEVAPGEVLGLHGPNGAGKTTLIRVLHLLARPDRGHLRWQGREVTVDDLDVRRRMALVAQEPHLFRGTVEDNLRLPLALRSWPRDRAAERVAEVADRFALEDLLERGVRELSGGQMQRVAFARAISPEPDVLFLDEFTANLDRDHRSRLIDAVRAFAAEGGAAVVAAHDTPTVRRLAERVVALEQGRIDQEGPTKRVLDGYRDAR